MGLVTESVTVQPGTKLTITMDYVNLFASSSSVLESLRASMIEDVELLKISGSGIGTRYAITFVTKIKAKALYFVDAFLWALRDIGYPRATYIQLETGEESSGLTSLLGDIGSSAGEIGSTMLGSALKSAFPYILGTIAIYIIVNALVKKY